jgi:glycosyltransferase involved in cell wall biosynthesis
MDKSAVLISFQRHTQKCPAIEYNQPKCSNMKIMALSLFKRKAVEFKKGKPVYDLIIYDDIYPHPASGFRMEEFTNLLNSVASSKAILSGAAYKLFNIPEEQHKKHVADLSKRNPSLRKKIEYVRGTVNINCKLFYCVFFNNMYKNLEWIKKYKIPFAFTLYPGGGFNLGAAETEARLRELFSSAYFRKVIVTQKRTYNYLIENKFCDKDDILFVFGVVVPQESLQNDNVQKKRYGIDKSSFDICFCATKYTKFGEDKGYPQFVEFMKVIAGKYDFTRFHVIGGFDKDVINVKEIEDRVQFYGYQDFDKLKGIFQCVDLIMSPNQPDKLTKGAFDGFPLGTVIEAAFNEVAVMATDHFGENEYFEDGKELVIIQPDVGDMVDKFDDVISDMDGFYKMAKKGREKFQYIYSNNYQLTPRIDLLKSLIAESSRTDKYLTGQ